MTIGVGGGVRRVKIDTRMHRCASVVSLRFDFFSSKKQNKNKGWGGAGGGRLEGVCAGCRGLWGG